MMVTQSYPQALWRRLSVGAASFVAAAAFGLAGTGVASAQQPSPAPVASDLSVEIDGEDGTTREGRDYRYEVTVRNAGPGAAVTSILEVILPDEFNVNVGEIGGVGNKTLLDSSDHRLLYSVAPLAPGEEMQFAIHGEFSSIGDDESGNTLNATALLSNPTHYSVSDTEGVDVRSD